MKVQMIRELWQQTFYTKFPAVYNLRKSRTFSFTIILHSAILFPVFDLKISDFRILHRSLLIIIDVCFIAVKETPTKFLKPPFSALIIYTEDSS